MRPDNRTPSDMEASGREPTQPPHPLHQHLDLVQDELSKFGKYQIVNFVLIAILIALNAWYTTSFVFTAADTPHRCSVPECDDPSNVDFLPPWLVHAIPLKKDDDFERCIRYAPTNGSVYRDEYCPAKLFANATIGCDEWVYADEKTIVSEFDLGCEEWKRTMIGTINNIGQLIALPITGILSDRFGRKLLVIVGIILSAITGLIRSFSTSYWMFFALELMDPVLGSGVYSAVFILGMELISPKQRAIGSTIIAGFYGIGQVILGLLAYYFTYWRTLLQITYAPGLIVISYYWIIPESINWLINKGKYKEAGDILKNMAKTNGITLSTKALEIIDAEYQSNTKFKDSKKNEDKGLLKEVLKSSVLMIRIAACSFWWITCTFVYYGLSLNSVSLAGNIYLNFIFICLIELPAYFIYYLIVDKFGRRKNLMFSFLGSGLSCYAFIFIPEDIFWLKFSFYMFGKFCITIAFTVLYVYTAEIYPTTFRHSLLGTCSMIGRIGSIVAPQAPLLSSLWEPLPLVLFGATSIISGFSMIFFPETLNIKLPETIEECLNIGKDDEKKKLKNNP